jgi:hypothetical protein
MTNKPTPPSPSELTELARASITKLLHERKVERVVIVDDVVDSAIELPEILGFLKTMSPDELTKFTARFSEELESIVDFEELKVVLIEKWKDFTQLTQTVIRDAAAKVVGEPVDKSYGDDLRVLGKFRECIEDIEFHLISPRMWMERKVELLLQPSGGGVVLCLFDQDLSKCHGFTADGGNSGIGLLKEVVVLGQSYVIPGILSHNINITGNVSEIDFWKSHVTSHSLIPSSFLPISKHRLRRFDDFANQLKFALVNQLSETVKTELTEVYKMAVDEAEKRVQDFDVYNFNHIVMDSSFQEGVSEIDTFIRVVDIYAQKKAEDLSIESDYRVRVQSLLNLVRSINSIDTGKPSKLPDPVVRNKLRHDELYVSGEVINKSHAPLQCGDIFKIGDKQFILLVQPCDLMVRTGGSREIDDKPRNLIGPLLPLSNGAISLEKHNERRDGFGFLQYIDPTSEKGRQVKFDFPCYIEMNVLDLSVLRDDGACRIDLSTSIEPPSSMHYPWVKRHENLSKEWIAVKDSIDKSIAEIDALESAAIRKLAWDGLLPCLSIPSLIQTDKVYKAGVIDFGISRVLRLREPEASSMLRAYMHYIAREAKDHDFAK